MTESSSSDTGFTREAGGGDEARAAPARALNSVATTGGTNESRSTSNLASDAAGVVVQHQEITRDGMAGSGRMSGGGTDPALRRRSSSSSRRIQPLPLSSAAAATVDQISFDPQLLLQEGLDEWQDRASDLRNLRRAASVRRRPASSEKTTPSKTPSFRFQERSQSARRHSYESNGDTEGSTHGAVQYSTGKKKKKKKKNFTTTSSFENSTTFLSVLNFHIQLISHL
jgi:hypothetical protein